MHKISYYVQSFVVVSNVQSEGLICLLCVDEDCHTRYEIFRDTQLVRNTRHLLAPNQMWSDHAVAVFDYSGKQDSAMGSLQQRLSTPAVSKDAMARKAQEKMALVAGDSNAQPSRNTSRAGHLEQTQIDGLCGSGGSDLESAVSSDSGPRHLRPVKPPRSIAASQQARSAKKKAHGSRCATSPGKWEVPPS